MNRIGHTSEELEKILVNQIPLIDVRAPVEFAQGHLPGAVNISILNDEERSLIGTIYKKEGSASAVKKGYEIVSGELKNERVKQWAQFAQQNPNCIIYCFRGGKRSQITQQWLSEAGFDCPIIMGGYKKTRNFLMQKTNEISANQSFLVITGPTGSGKTRILQELKNMRPVVDLEGLAQHRGSAFGSLKHLQPAQAQFENDLGGNLIQLTAHNQGCKSLLIEDESRLIGRLCIPENLFQKMRSSPVVWVDEPIENRVQNIFEDYILSSQIGRSLEDDKLENSALEIFEKYKNALRSIEKKLGGLRTKEVLNDLQEAQNEFLEKKEISCNKIWIEKLLRYYYDPAYLNSLHRRNVQISFKGNNSNVMDFLKSQEPVIF